MRFDDRLLTVLEREAMLPRDRAVQWRQLIELVARGGDAIEPALRARALGRIASLSADVPVTVRAAGARGVAAPDLPLPLIKMFAGDWAEVAAPVMTAALLDEAGWSAVRAAASPGVRALLAAIKPERVERAAVAAVAVVQPAEAAEVELPGEEAPLELDVVAPAAVQAPQPQAVWPEAPRHDPLPAEEGLFQWECGPGGVIDWVDGAARAAVIGQDLAQALDGRFDARLPFSDEALVAAADGALAGDWRWSGTPAFAPASGRFDGYRGTARREGVGRPGVEVPAFTMDGDGVRELVHELRTPLNAILGFGEIIEGQYLGPAHGAYRGRAGEIVRQARRLLSAVEDLDFAAKLRSGRGQSAAVAVGDLVPAMREALSALALRRGVNLTVDVRGCESGCAVDRELGERLILRFAAAVFGASAPGESIDVVIDRIEAQLAVAMSRPRASRSASEAELLASDYAVPGGEEPAFGFALRLTQGLATLARGRIDISPERLVLLIPLAGK